LQHIVVTFVVTTESFTNVERVNEITKAGNWAKCFEPKACKELHYLEIENYLHLISNTYHESRYLYSEQLRTPWIEACHLE
jgi:hypothetical protein